MIADGFECVRVEVERYDGAVFGLATGSAGVRGGGERRECRALSCLGGEPCSVEAQWYAYGDADAGDGAVGRVVAR